MTVTPQTGAPINFSIDSFGGSSFGGSSSHTFFSGNTRFFFGRDARDLSNVWFV